ncbi:hypothetical protein ACHAXT_004960 [Thalassiosira profunda]
MTAHQYTIEEDGIAATSGAAFDELFAPSPAPNDAKRLDAHDVSPPTRVSPFPSDDDAPAPRAITGNKLRDIEAAYQVSPDVLGRGRHGSVREARSTATGRRCAVKSIPKSHPEAKARAVRREIALLQELNHERVAHLIEVCEDENHVHIVTELYEGGELFDRILARSASDNGAACFPEEEAARIVRQILEAVQYLHSKGIVHRTVLRKRYTKACDLFSVGVIAYILMCGYPPFNGPTAEAVSDAILVGAYQFDTQDWAGTSRDCQDFIQRLLERDSRRRLTVAEALRHPWMARRAPEGDAAEMEEEAVSDQSLPESPSVDDVFEGFSRLVSCGTY